jgi:transposase-like protein
MDVLMSSNLNTKKKRTQRDYNLGFKLSVVEQVEQGHLSYKQAQKRYRIQGRSTVLVWLRKHGTLDWTNPTNMAKTTPSSKETPAQTIKRLERELEDQQLKNQVLTRALKAIERQHGGLKTKK